MGKPNLKVLMAHQRVELDPIATRRADWTATKQQIGFGALLNLGARDVLTDDDNGTVTFSIGTGGVHGRRAVVRLHASDTYWVDIVRLHRNTGATIVEASATEVYCDQLADTLIKLHHKAAHG